MIIEDYLVPLWNSSCIVFFYSPCGSTVVGGGLRLLVASGLYCWAENQGADVPAFRRHNGRRVEAWSVSTSWWCHATADDCYTRSSLSC